MTLGSKKTFSVNELNGPIKDVLLCSPGAVNDRIETVKHVCNKSVKKSYTLY
ncbi:hypothetical protein SAMN05421690_1001143 [Nitrosomonas sp. Nm51]|nr:hypothetical protein SAMN05421690_1001143 [Nitrosomonas sp. Nm51]